MIVRELSTADCRKVLSSKGLARLACSQADQPYIVPILCYFDEEADCLYSVAAVGQKIDWMRANPKVCVEFGEIADQFNWTTVLVFGRFEELTEAEADAQARRKAHELFEQRYEWWFPAMLKPASDERARAVVYRIRIERISGRQAAR